jgi:hypothetical protein
LIEALRRSVAAAAYAPTSPKAVLMLTMGLDDLVGRVGAGMVLGSRAADTLIAPDTVRKLACDAGIIPVVLGQDGEILDQGREQRLFTPAQVRALWLRDRHCTFPGCTAPAAWADAHHLVHWADGGLTDLTNGALLCPRHHTIVHRDLLAGVVTNNHVVWDLRPGSYHPSLGLPGSPHRPKADTSAPSADRSRVSPRGDSRPAAPRGPAGSSPRGSPPHAFRPSRECAQFRGNPRRGSIAGSTP